MTGPKEISPSEVEPTDEGYQVRWTPREVGPHRCTFVLDAPTPRGSRKSEEPSTTVQSNVYDLNALRLLRKLPDGALQAIEPLQSGGDMGVQVIPRIRAGSDTILTGSSHIHLILPICPVYLYNNSFSTV